jgi:hypothetical protein
MIKCDCCHTEYGGIRGVAASECARCAIRAADSTALPEISNPYFRVVDARPLETAEWLHSSGPLTGEIALLDRAYRS